MGKRKFDEYRDYAENEDGSIWVTVTGIAKVTVFPHYFPRWRFAWVTCTGSFGCSKVLIILVDSADESVEVCCADRSTEAMA